MRLFGSPAEPRSPLGQLRSPTSDRELKSMRARAWQEHGIASIAVGELPDPWLRQAITNEAVRRWGPRNGGHHGR
jgi:hypothetical protein